MTDTQISSMNSLAVLVVIAHPDDETLFAGFIHALKHKLHAVIDLICITNGEGGFRHAGPSAYLYDNLDLSKEEIGRQHLPRIRKLELLGSARIIGIRKIFFLDLLDLKKEHDVDVVFNTQWDKEWIIGYLIRTIRTANGRQGYDFMLIMLPDERSHAHHTASGLAALETIRRLKFNAVDDVKIPIVIAGSEFINEASPVYPWGPSATVSSKPENGFQFDRSWRVDESSNVVDYHTIVIWACSEHKSQGGVITETLTTNRRDFEQYYYLTINDQEDGSIYFERTQRLFSRLNQIHRQNTSNMIN